jgi:hypothetical protein
MRVAPVTFFDAAASKLHPTGAFDGFHFLLDMLIVRKGMQYEVRMRLILCKRAPLVWVQVNMLNDGAGKNVKQRAVDQIMKLIHSQLVLEKKQAKMDAKVCCCNITDVLSTLMFCNPFTRPASCGFYAITDRFHAMLSTNEANCRTKKPAKQQAAWQILTRPLRSLWLWPSAKGISTQRVQLRL